MEITLRRLVVWSRRFLPESRETLCRYCLINTLRRPNRPSDGLSPVWLRVLLRPPSVGCAWLALWVHLLCVLNAHPSSSGGAPPLTGGAGYAPPNASLPPCLRHSSVRFRLSAGHAPTGALATLGTAVSACGRSFLFFVYTVNFMSLSN